MFFNRRKYTVSRALDDYAADFLLRGCRSTKSLRSEIAELKRAFERVAVTDITIAALRRYQADRRGSGFAAATVNKGLAVLSAALNLAATNELIPAVPRFPRRLRTAAPRQGFLEQEDYLAIRGELPEWGRPVLDFGYYSGWRRNEVLGLTRDEVDLDAKQIRLHPDRSKNSETRVLPLMGFGLVALECAMSSPGETVFHREDGRRISSTFWHVVWSEATDRAGRPELHFHDLRRSVVRRLELAGVPRKTAMAWVGHRTEAIYLRYSITTEKDLVPAGEKMLRQLRPHEEGRVVAFPKKGVDK